MFNYNYKLKPSAINDIYDINDISGSYYLFSIKMKNTNCA